MRDRSRSFETSKRLWKGGPDRKRARLQHMPNGGTAGWSVQRGSGCLLIALEDDGLGIPEEELSHVANRFFRGRHRSASGSGLGLAIIDTCAPAAECKPNAEKQKRSNWPSGRGFDGLLNSRLARAAS